MTNNKDGSYEALTFPENGEVGVISDDNDSLLWEIAKRPIHVATLGDGIKLLENHGFMVKKVEYSAGSVFYADRSLSDHIMVCCSIDLRDSIITASLIATDKIESVQLLRDSVHGITNLGFLMCLLMAGVHYA